MVQYVTGAYQKGSKEIDLSHPMSLQVIRDTLLNVTTIIQTNIINWILSQESVKKNHVTSEVIAICLNALGDYEKINSKYPDRLDIAKLIHFNNTVLPSDRRLNNASSDT